MRSESKQENKPELNDAESRISSIDISNNIRFLRVIKIPSIPKKNINTGKINNKNIRVLCIKCRSKNNVFYKRYNYCKREKI
jgi:hypothetical protein